MESARSRPAGLEKMSERREKQSALQSKRSGDDEDIMCEWSSQQEYVPTVKLDLTVCNKF